MTTGGTGYILFLLSQGEISSSFLKYLPAGELITLARTNSAIRADLHDFGEPHPHTAATRGVRAELQVGHHETARWKRLKANAPYECSSSTHTKGTDVKPCRYCSRLICGACMTRASFANPGAKTFQNRCRSLCRSCWMSGNRHQRQKLTDDCECHHDAQKGKSKGNQDTVDVTKTCECTNKNDGWVCLECKHLQNKVWSNDKCFGQGCSNPLDSVADRRKMCMWCDKPLPMTATRENPHVYKQKVVDAMALEAAIRQADAEAYAMRRRKRLRMSLRELRGDEAVAGNTMADITDLVRHLDTMNYARLLGYHRSPTSEQVYNSKMGKWQYNREFLLSFRGFCDSISVPLHVKDATRTERHIAERTNQDVWLETRYQHRVETQQQQSQQLPTANWDAHREQIIRMRYLERRSAKYIQDKVYKEHGLWESEDSYRRKLSKWKSETELEFSRAGIPISNSDRSGSRYWQDIGSAVVDANENVHVYPGARKDSGSHDLTQPSIQGLLPSTIDPTAPASTSISHNDTGEATQPTHPKTRDESVADDEDTIATTTSPTVGRGISHILHDFKSRQAALSTTTSSNPEAMEQILAEQAALQLEWEEALLVEEGGGGGGESNTDKAAEGIGAGDVKVEQEEDDTDDVNLLIAIRESLYEVVEREGTRNENSNESREDGRPPVYFT